MPDGSPLPHPGVRFPPPLLYAAGLALGWLLHRARPLPITAAGSPARVAVAVAAIAVSLAIAAAAMLAFARARTAIIPNRPATALVTGGPYRFTRNPMYVALAALYVGLALLLDSWWPVLLLPLVGLALQRTVIVREERYLVDAFPEEYPDYCRRVRRWL